MVKRLTPDDEYRDENRLSDEQIWKIFSFWADDAGLDPAKFPRKQSILFTRRLLPGFSIEGLEVFEDHFTQTGDPELARFVRKLRRERQSQN